MPVPVLPPSKSPQAPAAWRPRHAAGREAARRWREAAVRALRAPRAVHVRIADKFSFFLGVVGCSVTQWVFLDAPEWMGVLYTCAIFPLLALRYSMYAARRMHYFLLDFCYFVQALLLLHVHVLPCDRRLHFALFALTTGPIGLAVLAWRNSLVFHSVDKMSSAFIHLLPVGVMHCIHWYPKCEAEQPGWRAAEASTAEWLAPALGIYATWQLGYVVLVDVLLAKEMRREPALMTSIRTLAKPPYGPFSRSVLRACRAARFMGRSEQFDADSAKTKVVFMSTQAVYTLVTLLPAAHLATSRVAHMLAMVGLLLVLTWNGAGYYFDVFVKRYETELQRTDQSWREAETRRIEAQLRAQIEAAASAPSPRPSAVRPVPTLPPGLSLIPSSGSLPLLPSGGGYTLADAMAEAEDSHGDAELLCDVEWYEPADGNEEYTQAAADEAAAVDAERRGLLLGKDALLREAQDRFELDDAPPIPPPPSLPAARDAARARRTVTRHRSSPLAFLSRRTATAGGGSAR